MTTACVCGSPTIWPSLLGTALGALIGAGVALLGQWGLMTSGRRAEQRMRYEFDRARHRTALLIEFLPEADPGRIAPTAATGQPIAGAPALQLFTPRFNEILTLATMIGPDEAEAAKELQTAYSRVRPAKPMAAFRVAVSNADEGGTEYIDAYGVLRNLLMSPLARETAT